MSLPSPSSTLLTQPHRRLNPLLNEHILVSPHRASRPWSGQTESPQTATQPPFDPECYLCPGNKRSGGQVNAKYESTWVFENDFASVIPEENLKGKGDGDDEEGGVFVGGEGLFQAERTSGGCDVVCFHARHDLTIAHMKVEDVRGIVEEWCRIYLKRGAQSGIQYVQIFENKGSMMGCSNPHPHGQVWSLSSVPTLPGKELANMRQWSKTRSSTTTSSSNSDAHTLPTCLLCVYAQQEIKYQAEHGVEKSRIVVQNEDFIALVPWWATWPFEIMILPYRKHHHSLLSLSESEKTSLADVISRMTKRYDNLFKCSFAYSMGLHQRPIPTQSELQAHGYPTRTLSPTSKSGTQTGQTGDISREEEGKEDADFAHFHMHFAPPLLRSATVRKFLVGFELMAESQRDLTPEQAAERLRACSEVHYMDEQVNEQASA